MKVVSQIGNINKWENFLLIQKILSNNKLCCDDYFIIKTTFIKKQGYKYKTVVEREIYVAMICPYLGFYPRLLAPHERQQEIKKYGYSFEFAERCSVDENKEMKKDKCLKIWNGKPNYIPAIIYQKDREYKILLEG